MKNKRGSAVIVLSFVFISFAASLIMAISIVKLIVLGSECRAFERVWAKTILSEYDVNLMNDYNIQAFYGNDDEVSRKLSSYLNYSSKGKLNADLGKISADLSGFEMSDPKRFKDSMKKGLIYKVAEDMPSPSRIPRDKTSSEGAEEDDFGNRIIRNQVVKNTLPSRGSSDGIDVDSLIEAFKNGSLLDKIKDSLGSKASDLAFINLYFGNYLTAADKKPTFFRNEWEYIAIGELDDSENYKKCKNRILLIRNGLNLLALSKDANKIAAIDSIATIISPGPAAIATKTLIMEAWALLEANEDLKILYDGGRVPLIKKSDEWVTSIEGILKSDKLKEELSEEAKKLMEENKDEIGKLTGGIDGNSSLGNRGQTYDDYILMMISFLSENQRLLRIMDLIQINMKYRYYEDFNFDEYYCGLNVYIKSGGRDYEMSDEYS